LLPQTFQLVMNPKIPITMTKIIDFTKFFIFLIKKHSQALYSQFRGIVSYLARLTTVWVLEFMFL
jgi:hypothetical protein